MNFKSFSFSSELLQALEELNFETLTPVQRSAIPAIRKGKDVLVSAQTGTGKTAAFALPLIQKLSESAVSENNAPSALVLAPTRELAEQIANNFKAFAKYTELKTVCLFGGINLAGQANDLKAGVDIVVATPGRLLDHIRLGNISLANVKHLVLDEADRMLDMGFIHDIKRLLRLVPKQRQNLLFSATFSNEIQTLAQQLLNNPALIEVAPRNTTAEKIEQAIYRVDRDKKRDLLAHLIQRHNWFQVLVFTRTKHGANRLAEQLSKQDIPAMAIHGNKSQGARTRALGAFKSGDLQVLVATDIAARGLDINELPHVVNFDLPNVAEDYVHRIGRTGRAGSNGEAVSLVCVDEHGLLKNIERLINQTLPKHIEPGFEPDPNAKPEPIENGRRGQRQPRANRKPGGQAANAGGERRRRTRR